MDDEGVRGWRVVCRCPRRAEGLVVKGYDWTGCTEAVEGCLW